MQRNSMPISVAREERSLGDIQGAPKNVKMISLPPGQVQEKFKAHLKLKENVNFTTYERWKFNRLTQSSEFLNNIDLI